MPRMSIERVSTLRASAADVWRHATSIAGINAEMAPWLRMTAPPEARELTLDAAAGALGEALFASRVLLLGVLPVERMQVTIVELEPGRRFVEQSPMIAMRFWRHERTVAPLNAGGGGCRVRDVLTFEPPLAIAARPMRLAIGAFFAHRHRRLVAIFGAPRDQRTNVAPPAS